MVKARSLLKHMVNVMRYVYVLSFDNVCRMDYHLQERDLVTLDVNQSGTLFYQSQVIDYSHCGYQLTNVNVVDFFMNTYEEDI